MGDLLKELWFDAEEGFDSQASLLKRARKVKPEITQAEVKAFLDSQELGRRQTRRPLKKNSYVPFGPREQFQVDLADMSGLKGTLLNSTRRALKTLEPFRQRILDFVGDQRLSIVRVTRFVRSLEGWNEAFRSTRLSTLRRALEMLGLDVETSARGGTSWVTVREGGYEPGTAPIFALVAIDSFSKFVHVVPLESKKPAATAKAMEEVIEVMGIPLTVVSDAGGEFRTAFAKVLQYYGIRQQFVRTHAYMAERVILTLKSWLLLRIRALGGTWIDHLPAVMRRYQSVVHSATGMSPEEAAKESNRTEVQETLEERRDTDVVRVPPLKVGDKVRLLQKPSKSAKFASIAWSRTLYEVVETSNDNGSDLYKLRDAPEDRFYLRFELLRP
jgi:hypothetical protein